MKLRIPIIVILLITSCNTPSDDIIDWSADIHYLKHKLPEKHVDLFFKRNKGEFDAGLNNIENRRNELSDFEMAMALQQLVARMGDSHSGIDWSLFLDKSKILPIKLYWFSDGIYITGVSDKYNDLLGGKVRAINDHPVSALTDSLSTLITVDNKAMIKKSIPGLLPLTQILDFFGFSDGSIYEINIESLYGTLKKVKVSPETINNEDWVNLNADSLAFCWANKSTSFTGKYFENDSVYYALYNRCDNKFVLYLTGRWDRAAGTPSFTKFKKKIFSAIEEGKVKKLIFDMRFNSGGNSTQGTKLINELAGIESINQKGKLYVVIGRRTFSSAIINTLDFLENTRAILVGENTGGKPNHYGEVRSFTLPSSKLKVYYSTKFFKKTGREMSTITPHVEIETSFQDYKRGTDPVYEWIKRQ